MKKNILFAFGLVVLLSSCTYGNSRTLTHDEFVSYYKEHGFDKYDSRVFTLGDAITITDNLSKDGDNNKQVKVSLSLVDYKSWEEAVDSKGGSPLSYSYSQKNINSSGKTVYEENYTGALSYSYSTKDIEVKDDDGNVVEGEPVGYQIDETKTLTTTHKVVNGDATVDTTNYTSIDFTISYTKKIYYSDKDDYKTDSDGNPTNYDTVATTYAMVSTISSNEYKEENGVKTYDQFSGNNTISYQISENNLTNQNTYWYYNSVSYNSTMIEDNSTSKTKEVISNNTEYNQKGDATDSAKETRTETKYTFDSTKNDYVADGDPSTKEETLELFNLEDFDYSEFYASKLYEYFKEDLLDKSEEEGVLTKTSKLFNSYFTQINSYMNSGEVEKEEISLNVDTLCYRYTLENNQIIQYRFVTKDGVTNLNEINLFNVNDNNISSVNTISFTYTS